MYARIYYRGEGGLGLARFGCQSVFATGPLPLCLLSDLSAIVLDSKKFCWSATAALLRSVGILLDVSATVCCVYLHTFLLPVFQSSVNGRMDSRVSSDYRDPRANMSTTHGDSSHCILMIYVASHRVYECRLLIVYSK